MTVNSEGMNRPGEFSCEWNQAYTEGMTMWYPSECIIRFITRHFKKKVGTNEFRTLRPAERVLDIGCGNGANVVYFREAGYEAKGCDISSVAVQLGNNWLEKCGYPPSLISKDITDLDFEPKQFDIIVSHAALDHILFSNFLQVIEKVSVWLCEKGYFFLTLRGTEGFEYEKKTSSEVEPRTLITGDNKELASPFENPWGKNIPQHFFTQDEIESSLSNFEIISLEKAVEHGGSNFQHVDSRWFITARLK